MHLKGPKLSYADILDIQTYKAEEAVEAAVKSGKARFNPIRPSGSGRCTRELAYALMEYTGQEYYEKEIREPNVTRLLSIGHYIEDSFKDQYNKYVSDYMKVRYEQQSVYSFELKSEEFDELNMLVEGSMDWCFVTEDHKGIIDAKSKKDKFSRFHKSDWDTTTEKLSNMKTVERIEGSAQGFWIKDLQQFLKELKDPFFEANFWQLNLYANTDWAKKIGIDHAAILQYNKNDSRIREVRFAPCSKLYKRTEKKFQAAVSAASKGDPSKAPRDHILGSIKCAFCPYSAKCWEGADRPAKEAFFDTFPKKKWPADAKRAKAAKKLDGLYTKFIAANKAADLGKEVEGEILAIMEAEGITKLKFKDGHVYEKKYYKSPRPHFKLKRTKL